MLTAYFKLELQLQVSSGRTAPPYGHRKGWIPRTQEVRVDNQRVCVHVTSTYPCIVSMVTDTLTSVKVPITRHNQRIISMEEVAKGLLTFRTQTTNSVNQTLGENKVPFFLSQSENCSQDKKVMMQRCGIDFYKGQNLSLSSPPFHGDEF